MERNVDLFCLVQVDRISTKGETFKTITMLRAYYEQGTIFGILHMLRYLILSMNSWNCHHYPQMRKLRLKELKLLVQSYPPRPQIRINSVWFPWPLTILYCFPGKSDSDLTLERNFEQNFLTAKWICFSGQRVSHAPHSWIII